MALILMLFLPKVLNILPLMPWWFFMLSPTNAMIDKSFSTIMGSILRKAISFSKAASMAVLANCASFSSIPKQMECSEEAWVIKITLIFSKDNVSNNRFEKPGIPIMPLPCKVNKAMLEILLMPVTGDPLLLTSLEMMVPAASGSAVFLI